MSRPSRWSGATEILVSTVVAGLIGYAITWLVFRWIGAAQYATFAVFWAAFYLVVGALSGVQQEVARATRSITPGTRSVASRSRNIGVAGPVVVAVIVAATSPLWAPTAFGSDWGALVPPLAIGTGSYVAVAVLGGTFYGIRRWKPIAVMMVLDALFRLVALVVSLVFTQDVAVLAWCVALPFPVVPTIIWIALRRRIVGVTDVDVGYRELVWNVARTVLASTSTAVMVSGFPLLVGLTAHSVSATLVGNTVFAVTLVRAPFIVSGMSLQSYLVVRFRDLPHMTGRILGAVLGALLVAGAVLAVVAALIGIPVLQWVSGGETGLEGLFLAALVLSSVAVAGLTVTGSAILAKSGHVAYVMGWLAAALTTISVMMVPMDFVVRVAVALLIGPAAGLLVHGVAVVRAARRPRGASE